ncbi:hypothetical protein [Metapseudomonas furukawaii]|jgi:hypothetical protein|uniref:3-phosphoglycerate kinase n=1 Tax=Metapseudomonas furukawaii TaxID=1149133 RepID=A0AAD1BX61_METFU|nr:MULTISPECIES: hypothetical protein [Pseudomonas]ELS28713.1 3-phosphoglycerate kinase [Pseudomonas furukawaii]OWJ95008.1 3-phosphoglycerate kinase [Pseudomonas sp. A46]WAG80667.1 3-phosphoglycerate kinase [Pseudomonas furukawaii]BAU73489.1 3-phosphoglycerate kinase [Pseudomonas furukawaii]
MKKRCCALIALLPALAFAYPIEVEKQVNGAEIVYDTTDIDNNLAAINIQNIGGSTAECRVVFVNGPETPKVRKAVIEAGKSAYLTANFNRAVIKLRIKLTCNPR